MDLIKTEQARNVISNLIGKVVVVTDNGKTEECVISGIYGIAELEEHKHLCFSFSKFGKFGCMGESELMSCVQMHISDWESLFEHGQFELCEGTTITLK